MVKRIVEEIKACRENDYHLSALALALTLPDICGKAEFPNEYSSRKRYIDWYDNHIGKYELERSKSLGDTPTEFPYLNGELLYQLRCSFLHTGDADIDKSKLHKEQNQKLEFFLEIRSYDDILSTSTFGAVQNSQAGEVESRKYTVCVDYLCIILANSALKYYEDNKEKFQFSCSVIDKMYKRL